MTTPDTPETLEQIARRIAGLCPVRTDADAVRRVTVFDAALSALRNERERAAQVAETAHDDKVFDVDLTLRNEIAKAIREGR